MKVLKIMTTDGRIFQMALERVDGFDPINPHFPDAAHVELVDMTPEEYQAIPATNESAERFGQ